MNIKTIGLIYTLVGAMVAAFIGYAVAILTPSLNFLTIFATIFIAIVIMKLVVLLIIKQYIIDRIIWLKDEVKRFNASKMEKIPEKLDGDCHLGALAEAIFTCQNKNLHHIARLEKQLEEKNDLLRENQYYIEHLESAILKNKKDWEAQEKQERSEGTQQ